VAKDVFDSSIAIEIRDALNGVLLYSSRFNWKLYEAFAEAYSVYMNILFKEGNTSKDLVDGLHLTEHHHVQCLCLILFH
jgi:hypothetical protein